jgi:hypothetical protein
MNPLVPIGEYRDRWLRALEALAVELRRPPHSIELARALGLAPHSVREMANRCARAGLVMLGERSTTTPRGLRLTPAARIALGLPLAVYLAFPVSAAAALADEARVASGQHGQAAAAELLERYGLFCTSPLLVPEAIGRRGSMDAATATAAALHAAIVWRDPLLVGRQDVDAARRAGVPVSVLAGPLPATAGELWLPPWLVPPIAADAVDG